MKLFTKPQEQKLLKNSRVNKGREDPTDFPPVVKLFAPWGAPTWLISELDPDDGDTMFGLCDLGFNEPEIGYVSLEELQSLKGPFGLKIERDLYWEADGTLMDYARLSWEEGRIVA